MSSSSTATADEEGNGKVGLKLCPDASITLLLCQWKHIIYVLLVRIRNVPLMTIHYLPIVPRSFLHAELRRDVVDVGCHFQVCKRLGAWKVFWLYYQYVLHKAVAEVSKIGNL